MTWIDLDSCRSINLDHIVEIARSHELNHGKPKYCIGYFPDRGGSFWQYFTTRERRDAYFHKVKKILHKK
jgi:hypothetical protein